MSEGREQAYIIPLLPNHKEWRVRGHGTGCPNSNSDPRKGGCVDLILTRGVKNPQNVTDVISEWPLIMAKRSTRFLKRYLNRYLHLVGSVGSEHDQENVMNLSSPLSVGDHYRTLAIPSKLQIKKCYQK